MKPFKCYWIYSSLFLTLGCAGFQTKPYSLSNHKADFMAEYCQAGKQKKAYKTTALFFTPKPEAKISLDKANQRSKKLEEQKKEFLKHLFYTLGDSAMAEHVANQGDEPSWYLLVAESERDVLDNIKNEDSDTGHRLFTFIVKILNQNKIIVYQSNQPSRRMSYDKGYSTDLANLMAEYTILAPKEIVEATTGSDFDSRYLYSSIILNENGEIDISRAIDRRADLWKSYIKRFTSIKEASEDNSRKSTVELALDLSVFCKYGRKITDLQAQ